MRRWIRKSAIIAGALSLAPLGEAQADDDKPEFVFGSTLSGNEIGGGWFLRWTPRASLVIPRLRIAGAGELFEEDQEHPLVMNFHAPVALGLNNAALDGSALRQQEWDEASEFIHIVRRVEYGTPWDGLYLRGGELANVAMGHGTAVNLYNNALNIDHRRWGLHQSMNTLRGGYELLVDDVVDPNLFATRLYLRPLALDGDEDGNRLAVGLTSANDFRAPLDVEKLDDGTYVLDENGALIVNDRGGVSLLGLDLEYSAIQGESGSFVPYHDINMLLGQGSGFHFGVLGGWNATDTLRFRGRAEYRLMSAGYLPEYFGALYDVERLAYNERVEDATVNVSKASFIRSTPRNGAQHGYLFELGMELQDLLRFESAWSNRTGDGNTRAWVHMLVPGAGPVQFGAWFINYNFEGAAGFFTLDESLVIAETRVMILDWLYAQGQLNRRWLVDPEGRYEPVDDFALGVGVSFGI